MSINWQWLIQPLPPKVGAAFWLIIILLLLATCIDWTDIRILDVDEEADTITVSVGPDVPTDDVYSWVSKECRDIMVLPPIAPVPVRLPQRVDTKADRTTFKFRCTRPD